MIEFSVVITTEAIEITNKFIQWTHYPLFEGLEAQAIEALFACLHMRMKRYAGRSPILHVGSRPECFGLVLAGSVHILREEYDGSAALLASVGEGEIFAEAFAAGHMPLTVMAQAAQEGAEVLWLPCERVTAPCQNACDSHAVLLSNFMRLLARKNMFLTVRISHLSKRSLRDKVLSYLTEETLRQGSRSVSIPFDRQGMADYLAADRSALSAVLCRLRREGVIEFQKNHFTLL